MTPLPTYPGTSQVPLKELTPTEVNKAVLDLLAKINELSSGTTSGLNEVEAAAVAAQSTADEALALAESLVPALTPGTIVRGSLLIADGIVLSTGAIQSLFSIQVPAGDWDLSGTVGVGAATYTGIRGGCSSTGTTMPVLPGNAPDPATGDSAFRLPVAGSAYGTSITLTIPTYRLNLTQTATIHLVVNTTFTAGAPSGWGWLEARYIAEPAT